MSRSAAVLGLEIRPRNLKGPNSLHHPLFRFCVKFIETWLIIPIVCQRVVAYDMSSYNQDDHHLISMY